jgi:hypothetical protein
MTENDAIKALREAGSRDEADHVMLSYLKRHGLDALADAWEIAIQRLA